MKYMGSKARIAKDIQPFIQQHLDKGLDFIEPFVGGANMTSAIQSNSRICYDINRPLVSMWKALQKGWLPKYYSKEEYHTIKNNRHMFSEEVVGWVGPGMGMGMGMGGGGKRPVVPEEVGAQR